MTPHVLPVDAYHWLVAMAHKHPGPVAGSALVLFVSVAGFFRWRLKRWGVDVMITSIVATALLVLIGASVYLLKTRGGYHFG